MTKSTNLSVGNPNRALELGQSVGLGLGVGTLSFRKKSSMKGTLEKLHHYPKKIKKLTSISPKKIIPSGNNKSVWSKDISWYICIYYINAGNPSENLIEKNCSHCRHIRIYKIYEKI
jgi:hypothetical protein